MLDATKSRLPVEEIDDGYLPGRENPAPDQLSFRTFLEKLRQQRRVIMALTLVGAIVGSLAGLAYLAIRVPAFSASSDLLISNTTLQLSGPEAVVTQILLENSLIESAMQLLRSGRVLERVIDNLGLEEVERILPEKNDLPWSGSSESLDLDRRRAAIALLRSNTIVTRVGASQILKVRARASSAMGAARLTNEIAAAFVKDQYDANAVVTTNAALRERIKVIGPTVRIVSEAAPAKSKDPPSAALAMLFAIALGGAMGAASSVTLILFDRRLRAAERLTAVTSFECFGYVPLASRQSSITGPLRKVPLLRHLFPKQPDYEVAVESILRRSLLRRVRSAVLERSTSAPYVVGVTSCRSAEGKTMFAARLARFLAHGGLRVLLIDACFPDVTSAPAQGQTPGLQELLHGTADLDRVVLDNVCPNLDFLPAGEGPGDLDQVWGNLVHTVNGGRERSYEWIILDLPELATAVDVRAAGQIIDYLLIVVEWGHTSERELQQALRALGSLQDRIVGTVINNAPMTSIDWTANATHADGRVAKFINPKSRTAGQSHD
jgi:succinoglycan biosynthesis transport protein ExoP